MSLYLETIIDKLDLLKKTVLFNKTSKEKIIIAEAKEYYKSFLKNKTKNSVKRLKIIFNNQKSATKGHSKK